MGQTPVPSYFRAHVSAAPLKLPMLRSYKPSLPEFPRSRERGPVEARRGDVTAGITALISALT